MRVSGAGRHYLWTHSSGRNGIMYGFFLPWVIRLRTSAQHVEAGGSEPQERHCRVEARSKHGVPQRSAPHDMLQDARGRLDCACAERSVPLCVGAGQWSVRNRPAGSPPTHLVNGPLSSCWGGGGYAQHGGTAPSARRPAESSWQGRCRSEEVFSSRGFMGAGGQKRFAAPRRPAHTHARSCTMRSRARRCYMYKYNVTRRQHRSMEALCLRRAARTHPRPKADSHGRWRSTVVGGSRVVPQTRGRTMHAYVARRCWPQQPRWPLHGAWRRLARAWRA